MNIYSLLTRWLFSYGKSVLVDRLISIWAKFRRVMIGIEYACNDIKQGIKKYSHDLCFILLCRGYVILLAHSNNFKMPSVYIQCEPNHRPSWGVCYALIMYSIDFKIKMFYFLHLSMHLYNCWWIDGVIQTQSILWPERIKKHIWKNIQRV